MISKYAGKLNMLAEKRQFTETFPFEAYHWSEKLEITKENEYGFCNQLPKLSKNSFYLTDPKNCVGQCYSLLLILNQTQETLGWGRKWFADFGTERNQRALVLSLRKWMHSSLQKSHSLTC